ncbi:hypothetical protein CHN50_08180 [Priestia aryabhattai]|uniref:YwpF family protein n=1 Tax=Priestia flexa TaxID=86664 RepID=UPI000BA148FA|nr:YwpF family protein [Priestia flexa]OZT13009.1 hypothetical protein CHN50_08180 [Priestia aryabhattai]
MKTFRLVGLQLIDHEGEKHNLELNKGLIINKEDTDNHWILEAVIDQQFTHLFELPLKDHQPVQIEALISKPTNDPALFSVQVVSVKAINDKQISVLMKGTLLERKLHFAEMILANLIEQGLTGSELLAQFKYQLHNKKRNNKTLPTNERENIKNT